MKSGRAVYEFVGPDGKSYRKVTFSAHGEVAYAQFIHTERTGWAFIGMESLVKYIAYDGKRNPKITHIKATRAKS